MRDKDQILLETAYENVKYFHANPRSDSEFNYGPVYHGGYWDGMKSILSRKGELGVGSYFTPSRELAISYAGNKGGYEGTGGGYLVEAFLNIKNPLKMEKGWKNYVDTFVKLGMDETKAKNMLERNNDRYGWPIGNELRKLGESKGYDCIFAYHNNELSEIVLWYPNQQLKVTKVEKV